jgi:hypothetical protein
MVASRHRTARRTSHGSRKRLSGLPLLRWQPLPRLCLRLCQQMLPLMLLMLPDALRVIPNVLQLQVRRVRGRATSQLELSTTRRWLKATRTSMGGTLVPRGMHVLQQQGQSNIIMEEAEGILCGKFFLTVVNVSHVEVMIRFNVPSDDHGSPRITHPPSSCHVATSEVSESKSSCEGER